MNKKNKRGNTRMKNFMDDDFLLNSQTAIDLYHGTAKALPIIDYHCHINPKDIAEDTVYENITQIWLYGDHYKWRAMRSNGVDEKYITGDASDYEKFEHWAATMPKLIGNPLYHWSHLELKRYFDIDLVLNEQNCKEIWEKTKEKIKGLSVRKIIEMSKVSVICTTDDPIDDLQYHKKIAGDKSFAKKVFPSFRPDKSLNVESPAFAEYIKKLADVCGTEIKNFDDLKAALDSRIEFFNKMSCKSADHGLEYIPYMSIEDEGVNLIFQKGLKGETLTTAEIEGYKTALLLHLAKQYQRHGWVMQLHFGVIRNANIKMFDRLGADTGFDTIGGQSYAHSMVRFFNNLEENASLPKTLIFSINPNDNAMIGTAIGCFQSSEIACKIQQGSAWWFNDTKSGMEEQLKSFANLSALGNYIGFLTDSRSFLSYTRHEYFRRILCNLIGEWVENGEYPADKENLVKMVEDICFYNAERYFGIDKMK
jgi:glucuronate isomerase